MARSITTLERKRQFSCAYIYSASRGKKKRETRQLPHRHHKTAVSHQVIMVSHDPTPLPPSPSPSSHFFKFQPLIYFSLAHAVILVAIYTPHGRRSLLLVPTWIFFAMSFMTLDRLPWSSELLSNAGVYLTIASLLWPVGLFTAEPLKIITTATTAGADEKTTVIIRRWNLSLRQAYKVYNNPRQLPNRITTTTKPPSHGALMWFAARRVAQAFALLLFRWTVIILCAWPGAFSRARAVDFSPVHEPLSSVRTVHDLSLRLSVFAYWLVQGVVPLQMAHFLLSIVFVSILRLDAPDEWPPLFASPAEAYSLRRFWGRFWHRLFSPGAVAWARFLARNVLGLAAGGQVEKALVPFVVFSVSGLAHAAIAWRLGDCCLDRDIMFFWLNFAAAFGETVVLKVLQTAFSGANRAHVGVGSGHPSVDGRKALVYSGTRAIGYVWVIVFFLWATPPYLYPKIYRIMVEKGL